MIKRLKIMLPYLNDEYTVGKYPDFINQASSIDNDSQTEKLGKVVNIESPESNCYLIYFENGISRTISDTPVQVDVEVSE